MRIGEQQIHRPARQPHPPLATGLVGHLLVREAVDQGTEDVDVIHPRETRSRKSFVGYVIELLGQRIGLGARLEAGDHPLEQQGVPERGQFCQATPVGRPPKPGKVGT